MRLFIAVTYCYCLLRLPDPGWPYNDLPLNARQKLFNPNLIH